MPRERPGPAVRKPQRSRRELPRLWSCCEPDEVVGTFMSDHAKFAQDRRDKEPKGAPGVADPRLIPPPYLGDALLPGKSTRPKPAPPLSKPAFPPPFVALFNLS